METTSNFLLALKPTAIGLARPSKWRDLAIILLWPLVLLLIDRHWIFTPTPSIDPWVYTGYFFNLPQHLRLFLGTYYETRLPWILPGYVVYHLFPPLLANYVLHLAFYYVAIVSLYFILAWALNARVALLIALVMGSHAGFLMAIGWDYVDGAGIAYLLLTMFLLSCAARRDHWWIWMFLSGAAYAALTFTNLFLVIFGPFLAAYYIYFNHYLRRRNVLLGGIVFGIGAVALMLVLCLINYQLTGLFWFFQPSLQLVTLPPATTPEDFSWVSKATWMLGPTLIVLSSVVFLVLSRIQKHKDNNRFVVFFQVQLLVVYLLFAGLDAAYHQDLFKTFYYASYLLPFTFLALGAQLANRLLRVTAFQAFALLGAAIILLLGAYSFTSFSNYLPSPLPAIHLISLPMPSPNYLTTSIPLIYNPPIFTSPYSSTPPVLYNNIVMFFLFSMLVVASIAVMRTTVTRVVSFFVCVVICLYTIHPGYGNPVGLLLSQYGTEDDLLIAADSFQVIQKIYPDGQSRFWYDSETDALTDAYTAIASTYLFEYRLISRDFPQLSADQKQLVPIGTEVVILSDTNDVFQKAVATLRTLGLSARLIAQQDVSDGYLRIKLTFIEITALDSA